MINKKNYNHNNRSAKMILVQSIIFHALFIASEQVAAEPISVDVVRQLVNLKGIEYQTRRDELLTKGFEQLDVAAMAAESWEMGIAAAALNARKRSPKVFQSWDKLVPRIADHRGVFFRSNYRSKQREQERHKNWITFLFEVAWNPQDPAYREYAIKDLYRAYGFTLPKHSDSTLWRSIWEHCPDERLQAAALTILSSGNDPRVLDIIANVLQSDTNGDYRNLKQRCLYGLIFNELPEAADIILSEWDRLRNESSYLGEKALAALAASPNPRARQAVYKYALDTANSDRTRLAAVIMCSERFHSGDHAFLLQFLAGIESPKLKRDVLSKIGDKFPIEWVRPILRDILATSDDSVLLNAATASLTSAYIVTTNINLSEIEEDIALFRKIAVQTDMPETLRLHIQNFSLEKLQKCRDQQIRKLGSTP